MLADFAALFCADITAARYISSFRFLMADKELLAGIKNDLGQQTPAKILWRLTCTLPDVFRLYLHSRKMKSKWPWVFETTILLRPLNDIRQQYHIQLVKSCQPHSV